MCDVVGSCRNRSRLRDFAKHWCTWRIGAIGALANWRIGAIGILAYWRNWRFGGIGALAQLAHCIVT